MVLNGKAELLGKVFRATKTRNERVELCAVLMLLSASTVISFRLYYCMEDGWQTNTHLRWQVFTLSIALLFLSATACFYLCRRHRLTVYLDSTCQRSLESVLVSGERPPNYNTVKANTTLTSPADFFAPPPPYNALFNV